MSNIRTGNAILTSIVIAMFAYLFVKLNIKFIIRQFTLIVFTVFTPIVATLWIINRKTIGASIWFGQIMINSFMQLIYAFLFLIYLSFLPVNNSWAINLLWAMMILPLADVLQNTLQNLVSKVAGIQNDDIANRGIGMAHEMAYTINAFAYQFKTGKGSEMLNNFVHKTTMPQENNITTTPAETTVVKTNPISTSPIKPLKSTKEDSENLKKSEKINRISKLGNNFMNIGMYMSEGKSFRNNSYQKNNNIINENEITDKFERHNDENGKANKKCNK